MAYTDIENRILDMWPKFEDGSYVQLGDSYIDTDGDDNQVMAIEFNDRCTDLVGLEGFHTGFDTSGERVKRPAPKVLDADGVEIKVGDTVYDANGEGHIVKEVYFDDDESHEHTVWCGECKLGCRFVYVADQLSHTRPDSWEQLEEDAGEDPFRYCKTVGKRLDTFDNAEVFKSADLVRRAKALAEKEAAR